MVKICMFNLMIYCKFLIYRKWEGDEICKWSNWSVILLIIGNVLKILIII